MVKIGDKTLDVPTDNMTAFNGVLIERQYQPGQRYVQLVFETADGLRLTLTRNADLVRDLVVGSAYYVEGNEYTIGNKTFVHEPVAMLLPTKKSFFGKRLLVSAAVLLLAVGVVSSVFMFGHGGDAKAPDTKNASSQTPQPEQTTDTGNQNPVSSNQSDVPAATAVVTPPAAVSSPTTTTTSTRTTRTVTPATSSPTPAPNPAPAPAPAPEPVPEPVPVPPPVVPPADPPADPPPPTE
jgi:hypothetical protein